MPPLSRGSSWPLYLHIADDLREQVLQQRLRPGERVPSEKSLMQTYDASRQTVRKAISVLKTEGLLDAAQGQGVFGRRQAALLRRRAQREWETDLGGGFEFDLPPSARTEI